MGDGDGDGDGDRAVARARRIALGLGGVLGVIFVGCGESPRELFVRPYDAGIEASTAATDAATEPEVDPTLGGPCREDAQCDDAIACTYDRCDLALGRCRNTPDDSQCADDTYCNGQEKCELRIGCRPGPVVTCDDGTPCTIDRCVEATKSCEHQLRDVDLDGDPDEHCDAHHDCNDADPTVSSRRTEVCDNFKDDDCDGQIDEQPCEKPQNDVCETALHVTAPSTYLLSSVAAKKDYASSCDVASPAAAQDLVIAITIPGGPGDAPMDVDVWATAPDPTNEVAVALRGACGQTASELACGHVAKVASARTLARSAAAGSTLFAIVTTQSESPVDVKVDLRPGTTKPANETCAAPAPVDVDVPFTVSLVDATRDLATGCDKEKTGELTVAFTLTEPRDVRVFASTVAGAGTPVVSLRGPTCTDELRCRVGTSPPLFARSLPAGTHVLAVGATSPLDASVLVQSSQPTPPPPNQSCATAPELLPNTNLDVDLAQQEDAIHDGCFEGGPAAAYALSLGESSDVLVVARFPTNEVGGVALSAPGCAPADVLRCASGPTPDRVSRRNLPAGSYRVVVADEHGQTARLIALVRPTTPPVDASGADGCTSTRVIPEGGGFFTGDTSALSADFGASCDAPGMGIGGAKDALFRLDLSAKRRIVLDTSGSAFTTLLDVRRGATCPGTEVPDACYVGFGPGRSFLDLLLDPGTYWIQLDGYAGEAGAFQLDVRALPPPL